MYMQRLVCGICFFYRKLIAISKVLFGNLRTCAVIIVGEENINTDL